MDVIYKRVAGLDVHKEAVVATVRVIGDGKAERECRTFETTAAGLVGPVGLADGGAVQPCGDGDDRRLLEAGVEHLERRRFRERAYRQPRR